MSRLVTGRQGDATEVVGLLGADSVDVVICHSVLEVVDEPSDALAAIAAVLRPGGLVSVLVTNRVAAVVTRVASGRLGEARHLLGDAAGHAGPGDPLARRFTLDEITDLVTHAGLQARSVRGIRVFSDIAPAALLDIDPAAAADLLALERQAAQDPAYTCVATQLHLLAERS
jgi:SAM-dependent methyltransferase